MNGPYSAALSFLKANQAAPKMRTAPSKMPRLETSPEKSGAVIVGMRNPFFKFWAYMNKAQRQILIVWKQA